MKKFRNENKDGDDDMIVTKLLLNTYCLPSTMLSNINTPFSFNPSNSHMSAVLLFLLTC